MAQIYPTGTFDLEATRTSQITENADQTARTTRRSEPDVRIAARAAAGSGIRQDRVDALRTLVQSGQFNPAPHDIADAILRDERGTGRV
jgi:anti-sigma28 factor (negative regulator of flagellin synthesis)